MAANSFGLNVDGFDKPATLNAIEHFLHEEARAGRRCLLVVDEAQNLSVGALEELRMLSNFQLGSIALLQIFLLGQPEFRDLVHESAELEQLRQRVIATHHLSPMDEDEVEPYVEHRLKCAGWNGNPKFSEDAYNVMFEQTNGVPRQLNTLMQRVLLMGAVEELRIIDGEMIKAVIADMAGKPFEYEAPLSAKAGPEDIPQAMYDKAAAEEALEADEEVLGENSEPEATEVQTDEAVVDEASEDADIKFDVEDMADDNDDDLEEFEQNLMTPVSPYYGGKPEYVNIAAEDYQKLLDRVDMLEAKLSEHDMTLRQTLSMMIQWMEDNEEVHYDINKAA